MPHADATLTVVIPVYNAAAWIDACIQKILTQRELPDEVLFVDDASTDATCSICHTWQSRLPFVHVLSLPANGGPGLARNAGIQAARKTYITFIDVDDRLEKDYFLLLRSAMREPTCETMRPKQADVAVCGMTIHNAARCAVKTVLPPRPCTSDTLLEQHEILYSPFTKCYRRAFILDNGLSFPPCRMGEDMAFAVKLCCLQPYITGVYKALYHYQRRAGSLTGGLAARQEIFTALRDVRIFLNRQSAPVRHRSLYRRLVLGHAVYYPLQVFLVALWRHELPLSAIFAEAARYLRTAWRFMWSKT